MLFDVKYKSDGWCKVQNRSLVIKHYPPDRKTSLAVFLPRVPLAQLEKLLLFYLRLDLLLQCSNSRSPSSSFPVLPICSRPLELRLLAALLNSLLNIAQKVFVGGGARKLFFPSRVIDWGGKVWNHGKTRNQSPILSSVPSHISTGKTFFFSLWGSPQKVFPPLPASSILH